MDNKVFGFTSGGRQNNDNFLDTIDKFSFASNIKADDHGDMSKPRWYPAGNSSLYTGHIAGGWDIQNTEFDTMDFFNFMTNTKATDQGNLVSPRWGVVGVSNVVDGYTCGGLNEYIALDVVEKLSHSVNNASSVVGSLSSAKAHCGSMSNDDAGYICGGWCDGVYHGTIEKIHFTTGAFSVTGSHGIRSGCGGLCGHSSGLICGGRADIFLRDILKFTYDNENVISDHGELTGHRADMASHSSSNYGYLSGGVDQSGEEVGLSAGGITGISSVQLDNIDRVDFDNNICASDHGDISIARYGCCGHQG
jgi:hypothetical protein